MELCQKDLEDFLQHLDQYKRNLKKYNPGNPKETLQLIEDQIRSLMT